MNPWEMSGLAALLYAMCLFVAGQIPSASPEHRDPVPLHTQMVPVDVGVQLEVLDWGGTGRPVVLLAGLGDTAHVFDDFAPLLSRHEHVYGITRRGYGASTHASGGYGVERLGRDVIGVIDALHLQQPVVAGHSIAGEEMSWIANNAPEKVSGLVYLDAAQGYALYDAAAEDLSKDVPALELKLNKAAADADKATLDALVNTDLPRVEHELRVQREKLNLGSPAAMPPTEIDKASLAAFERFIAGLAGAPLPEAEVRAIATVRPDGSIGDKRSDPATAGLVLAGTRHFTAIPKPVLAIFACPHRYGGSTAQEAPEKLARRAALDREECEEQALAVAREVPTAKVVLWPDTFHAIFLVRPEETAREIDAFVRGLPKP